MGIIDLNRTALTGFLLQIMNRKSIKLKAFSYPNAQVLSPVPAGAFQIFDVSRPDLIVKTKQSGENFVIPLNKDFICENVSYFEAMFREGSTFREQTRQTESGVSEVTIEDVNPEILHLYFRCIYDPSVEINPNYAFDLHAISDYFQDAEMKNQCLTLIKKSLDSSPERLFPALEFPNLEQKCAKMLESYDWKSFNDNKKVIRYCAKLSLQAMKKLLNYCSYSMTSKPIEAWLNFAKRNDEEILELVESINT